MGVSIHLCFACTVRMAMARNATAQAKLNFQVPITSMMCGVPLSGELNFLVIIIAC